MNGWPERLSSVFEAYWVWVESMERMEVITKVSQSSIQNRGKNEERVRTNQSSESSSLPSGMLTPPAVELLQLHVAAPVAAPAPPLASASGPSSPSPLPSVAVESNPDRRS
jgi:hypothetical protein